MHVRAYYFDGKTSRRQLVTLRVEDDVAYLSDAYEQALRTCPLAQLRVSERFNRAARKVTFPDGAYLEVQDHEAFAGLLQATGHYDSWIVRMQQNWRTSLSALLGLIALLVVTYLYVLPGAASLIARALPVQLEQQIGSGSLQFLDAHIFAPTRLPAAQQAAITARFRGLTSALGQTPPYTIVFRRSRIGPNALALPDGNIVLTDEIVQLLADDDAVMGVLAHELGHLRRRHLMQRLIQTSMIAAGATLLFGDVSVVLANIPTVLLDLKYSRDIERQADDEAVALFKANGMSRQKLADVFEKLEARTHGDSHVAPYLSSHPANAERIERILHAP